MQITLNINGDLFDRMERVGRALAPDAAPRNGLAMIRCIELADELTRAGGHGVDTEITIHSPRGDRRVSLSQLIDLPRLAATR